MRLWHQNLIPLLPRQQLLGQHRECCALRGNGWGKRHSVVDYVFTYPMDRLVAYHMLVAAEMIRRGFHVDNAWFNVNYRGQKCMPDYTIKVSTVKKLMDTHIYPEHDKEYLRECISNLAHKNIILVGG